ncbi:MULTISPECIES: class I SAM-dependent methyltransferase [unclassified Solwaraspora]|uniref:class I SAM-dependent methyltransferase n=1 Tax=unclassified Solwaraspora TaxID=2627926 RepID=UPI00259BC9F4|nr:class I SAM-dependent methyltransferase [Solwaraspora sp. WMMA2056]WJK38236.1 class I SAM-dependent methyltransferase [Solwaraspora sp. WMMA2056]
MLAEFMARTGNSVIRNIPPDGRAYWAARFWDRDTHEQHPVLGEAFLQQKATVAELISRHAADTGRVLEFACGTGEFTRLAAERTRARQITAVDISAEGLRRARARVDHDNLELIQGDFWADHGVGTSELVMCLDAIHHLGDVRQVLTRLRGFVAPGGTFIGNLWTVDNFHQFQRLRYGRVAHLRRTAGFLGTALMIRTSGGRLRTGAYRTQLLHSDAATRILRDVFDEVVEVRVEDYFMAFACRVAPDASAGPDAATGPAPSAGPR